MLAEPGWVDRALVIAVFTVPPASIFIYLVLREWLYLRRWKRRYQTEEDSLREEGFPPGPPRPPPSIGP